MANKKESVHGNYRVERVSFPIAGVELVGNLYIPNELNTKVAALPIIGPFSYVKEQAPVQYATRLADEGFVTLAFDCRTHGESAGTPRRYENPMAKVADVKAAIDYLQSRPEVDAEQIGAVGVCQGCSEMMQVVVDDPRVKALATVSGQYLDHGNKVEFLGEEGLAMRLKRGKAAKAKYEETGEVEYVPVVDPVRTDVGLPHKAIWDWYHGWADRGIWENRYATMSDAEVWTFDSLIAAAQVQCPLLMIHADNSDGPAAAHRHFEAVPTTDKRLIWEGSTAHFQYYEDPMVIDRAVGNIARWFREHLV